MIEEEIYYSAFMNWFVRQLKKGYPKLYKGHKDSEIIQEMYDGYVDYNLNGVVFTIEINGDKFKMVAQGDFDKWLRKKVDDYINEHVIPIIKDEKLSKYFDNESFINDMTDDDMAYYAGMNEFTNDYFEHEGLYYNVWQVE